MYYIGIDGGGTKTSFKLYNEQGQCLKTTVKETCHLLQVSAETAILTLQEGVQDLIKGLARTDELLIGLGLAGYGEDEKLRVKIEQVCQQALDPYEYYLFNDVSIALEGALNGEDGILIIAGTGSIALSKKDGFYRRVGGWGYMLGDEGSAYWLAKEIFRQYTMQVDGRSEKTHLIPLVKNKLSLKQDYELITYFANEIKNDRREIAKHAILLEELIQLNDPVAFKILDQLVEHLSILISTLGKDFNQNVNVSYLGGVFNLGRALFERLDKKLAKHIQLVKPVYPPEKGAVILAQKKKVAGE